MAAISSVLAATSIVGGLVVGVQQQEALNNQSKAIADAAVAEQSAYSEAQELLGKSKDAAITDVEAANLRAQGLIDDGTEAAITRLNQTEGGAIETLKEFTAKSDEIYATTEQLIVKDLQDSGVIQRADINKGALDAIETISGGNLKIQEAFEPFIEAGKRGLEKQQFLSGLLTEEEKAAHVERFGAIEGSPLFEFRKQEATEALSRRQKAQGRVFSGKGLEEELQVTNRLSAEESERQLQQAFGLSQQGLQATGSAAGFANQATQNIANLQQARGVNLAGQASTQAQGLINARQTFGLNRGALQSQLGANISNVQLSLGQARARLRENQALNQARLAEGLGTETSFIRTGTSAQQSNLAGQAAQSQFRAASQQAQIGAQAQVSPFSGLLAGLGTGAQFLGFQQGQQGQQQPVGLQS